MTSLQSRWRSRSTDKVQRPDGSGNRPGTDRRRARQTTGDSKAGRRSGTRGGESRSHPARIAIFHGMDIVIPGTTIVVPGTIVLCITTRWPSFTPPLVSPANPARPVGRSPEPSNRGCPCRDRRDHRPVGGCAASLPGRRRTRDRPGAPPILGVVSLLPGPPVPPAPSTPLRLSTAHCPHHVHRPQRHIL